MLFHSVKSSSCRLDYAYNYAASQQRYMKVETFAHGIFKKPQGTTLDLDFRANQEKGPSLRSECKDLPQIDACHLSRHIAQRSHGEASAGRVQRVR